MNWSNLNFYQFANIGLQTTKIGFGWSKPLSNVIYLLVVNDTRLPHVAPVFPTNPVEKDIHEHKLKLLKMGQDESRCEDHAFNAFKRQMKILKMNLCGILKKQMHSELDHIAAMGELQAKPPSYVENDLAPIATSDGYQCFLRKLVCRHGNHHSSYSVWVMWSSKRRAENLMTSSNTKQL